MLPALLEPLVSAGPAIDLRESIISLLDDLRVSISSSGAFELFDRVRG